MEKLIGYLTGLARVLAESGLSGSQLNEVFATNLRVHCTRCSIHVTGDELMSVAVADKETNLPHPKLERLRLGYCAREGCESDFYTIRFEGYAGVDWAVISDKTFEWLATSDTAKQEEIRRTALRRRNRAIVRVVLGVIVVCSLLLCRFALSHGRLPFVVKPSKYQVDPASTRNRPVP